MAKLQRPPSGGPCLSVFQANNKGGLHFREHMAFLRRAERPTTRTINMTLLRRGGRNGQTRTMLTPSENERSPKIRPDIHTSSCLPCFLLVQ